MCGFQAAGPDQEAATYVPLLSIAQTLGVGGSGCLSGCWDRHSGQHGCLLQTGPLCAQLTWLQARLSCGGVFRSEGK